MKRPRFFKRRQVPLPTWPILVAGPVAAVGFVLWAASSVHPFLAVTKKIEGAEVLVVEGWLADYNMEGVVKDYRSGGYQVLGTTGTPLDKGSYLLEYDNYARVTAETLKTFGLSDEDLLVASAPQTFRHRTYHSAKAMREAIENSGRDVAAINVVSQTVHARRSWMVYSKVFGDSVEVGILALPNESYDNDRWWESSYGIKAVGMEFVAFVHEWLFDSGRSENE